MINQFNKSVFSPLFAGLILVLTVFSGLTATAVVRPTSDSLKQKIDALKISGLTVTDVQSIPAGAYTPKSFGTELTALPAFCLVAATISPTAQSRIKIEIWMPIDDWNGRLLGTGNGGLGGRIQYNNLAGGIRKGYATTNTDMGTSMGADSSVGKPEIWADFGYRSTHLMTEVSKAIIKVFYGRAQHHGYFSGCSTGGQQALMEAQRFPDDYNGILAGAPANNRTHLHTGFLLNYQQTNGDGKPIFTADDLDRISKKIAATYAMESGGAPGDTFLTDPGLVRVDFDRLFGRGELSTSQIAALKMIYKGPINSRTGEQIYTSPPAGSDNVAGGLVMQMTEAGANGLFYPFKWLFGKDFNKTQFDYDRDQDRLDSLLASSLNANNPDLSPLQKRGGKIIMYQGTADPLVPYQDAVNYYERVVEKHKGLKPTQEFFRYYLVPGMGHCSKGPGLGGFEHDILDDLVDWVEKGKAPEKLVANALNCCEVGGPLRFKRPVFPYPLFPKYVGGDVNDPANYVGAEHKDSKILRPAERYLN